MIEPRVYRAAFLPAVIALAVAMFSLESQPRGVPLDLAADVLFEGDAAAALAQRIARQAPDRSAGSAGDLRTGELVARNFEQHGFDVEVDRFSERGRELANVIGTRIGSERERIVVAAARDASGAPDVGGAAADTAALVGLATALEGRAPEKTIVLASLDGSTLGQAGARRFAETAADREEIEAVLVLSDVGAPSGGAPALIAWSNDAERGSLGLYRTAQDALRSEFGAAGGEPGAASQLAHLALPVGVGAQGVFLDAGLEALRFSGSGLLPPGTPATEADANSIGGLGRATLGTVSALDAGEDLEHGPGSYVTVARSVLPEWPVALLSLALILPALVASVDAFARARRRREPVAAWVAWVVARAVPFLLGLLIAILLVIVGAVPNVGAAAPAPTDEPVTATGAAALGGVVAVVVLAWIFVRPLLARMGDAPSDPAVAGAGCSVALFATAATLALWLLNPWAALALVPAAHLWALAALADTPRGWLGRALLVAGGLALPACIALLYAVQLSLDPLQAVWYLLLLVAGGQIGLPTAIVGCVLLGVLAALIEIVVARTSREETAAESTATVRGPGGYAGPGSLGGTESALKR